MRWRRISPGAGSLRRSAESFRQVSPHVGQSLVAGTPIAEILDPTDIFVDWYIPNARLIDPEVGNEVLVLFGNRRIPGKIAQILPVSGVYAGTQQQLLARDRPATQIARIRFDPGARRRR